MFPEDGIIGGYASTTCGPAHLQVSMTKAENGFIVTVYYPAHMLPKPHNPMEGMAKAMTQMGAGGDPQMIFQKIGESLQPADKNSQLRRPTETYVFTGSEALFKFLKELLSSS